MSKHETPMIHRYWRDVGGTLIEEFPAIAGAAEQGPRRLDAIIIIGGERRIASWREVSLEGRDIIVVQAKAKRLGMPLMGQTLFSAELAKRFKPASVRSVALCTKDDAVLRPLLERFDGCKVVVDEIDWPTEFEISIGGYTGPSYTVRLLGKQLSYGGFPPLEPSGKGPEPPPNLRPSPEEWRGFWKAMDQVDVWGWAPRYETPGVCDGTRWSVKMAVGDKRVCSSGDNAYPGGEGPQPSKMFRQFLAAVRRLLGGVEFE